MEDIDDFSALGGVALEYLARQQWEGERERPEEPVIVLDEITTREREAVECQRSKSDAWTIRFGDNGKDRHGKDRRPVKRLHNGRWIVDLRSGEPFSVRHGWIDRSDKPQEPGGPPIRQLKDERWYLKNLEAADELNLIHRAQAGDGAASETLFRHHYKQIITIIEDKPGKRQKRWHKREKRRRYHRFRRLGEGALSIALEGFFSAVQKYTLSKSNGARLSTYAASCVEGRLLDAVKPKALFGTSGKIAKDVRIKINGPDGADLDVEAAAISTESRSAWHGTAKYPPSRNPFAREQRGQRDIEREILRGSFGTGDSLERIALAQDEAWARRIKEIGRRAAALELVERRRVIGKTEYLQHEPNWKVAINERYEKSKRRQGVRNDKPAVAARNGAPYRTGRIRAWNTQGAIHQVGMRAAA